MNRVLDVESVAYATFQDLGRSRQGLVGVPRAGAADQFSARLANALVGNDAEDPLVEITASALTVRARDRLLVAVTGAASHVEIDGTLQPANQPLVLQPGSRLRVPDPVSGLRSYLAINGRIDAPRVLGSVAPEALLSHPSRLVRGDSIRVESSFEDADHPHYRIPVFRFPVPPRATTQVLCTPGPEANEFPADPPVLSRLFTVSPDSDHIGLRLVGEVPARSVSTEILSRGVPLGAIEAPPGGGLIVLLRGRLVTAGYPVIAVVSAVSLDILGQARPESELRFHTTTATEAVALLRRQQAALGELRRRVATAFTAVGLAQVLADGYLHDPYASDTSARS